MRQKHYFCASNTLYEMIKTIGASSFVKISLRNMDKDIGKIRSNALSLFLTLTPIINQNLDKK